MQTFWKCGTMPGAMPLRVIFGNNKLLLTVEPKYAKTAMEIYKELDPKKYYRVAVLDTEKVLADEQPVLEGALAEEVEAGRDYAQAYINFQLGKVIKCDSVDGCAATASALPGTACCITVTGSSTSTRISTPGPLILERRACARE